LEYFLSEQQKTLKSLARRIAEERILPVRAELDEREEFPWEIIKDLANADMFRIFIPEEYEGLGGGCLDLCLVVEELSRVCSGIAVSYAASALGGFALLEYGTETQKQKYLPDIAAGKKLTAFALTEPTAGSDASAIKTTAERVKEGYIINGTKQFITNGGEAEIYTVIALTDKERGARGASTFLVEKDTPGFSFGKKEKKMGIRASSTRELIFRNCLVPEENMIGKEGMGFIMTLRILDRSRPGIGAQAVLTYAVARTVDSGAKHFTEEAAMAKVFASDIAMKVTTDAVQILGGAGYMKDYPVEKMMRDAKITQIYEGTNQVLRNTIAFELRKRKAMRE